MENPLDYFHKQLIKQSFWCLLSTIWTGLEQTVQLTVWDYITLMWHHFNSITEPLYGKGCPSSGLSTAENFWTHWGRVMHICVVELGHHWFRQWLVTCSAPSHYLNQCWNIVNWTFRNKLQWIFNRNTNIFVHEIAFENVVCDMASMS